MRSPESPQYDLFVRCCVYAVIGPLVASLCFAGLPLQFPQNRSFQLFLFGWGEIRPLAYILGLLPALLAATAVTKVLQGAESYSWTVAAPACGLCVCTIFVFLPPIGAFIMLLGALAALASEAVLRGVGAFAMRRGR